MKTSNTTQTIKYYEAFAKFKFYGLCNYDYSELIKNLLEEMEKPTDQHKISEPVKKEVFNCQDLSNIFMRLDKFETSENLRNERLDRFAALIEDLGNNMSNSIGIKEAAKFLGISERKVHELASKKVVDSFYIDGSHLYRLFDLAKYRQGQIEKNRQAGIKPIVVPSSNDQNLEKTTSKKYEITLKGIEFFTISFTREENGYLDDENAQLTNNLFSNIPLPEGTRIRWDGTTKALILFLCLTDSLGLVETNMLRKHNYYWDKDVDNKKTREKELSYGKLIKDFFIIPNDAASESTVSRLLGGVEYNEKGLKTDDTGIVGALCDLWEQVRKMPGYDKLTMKEVPVFYFENKDRIRFKISEKLDKKLLDIVGDVFLKYLHKETTEKRLLIPKK